MEDLYKSRGNKPRTGKVITCMCGKGFYLKPSAVGRNNFCSRACSHKFNTKDSDLVCLVCSVVYHRPPSQVKWRGSKYCSRVCQGIAKSSQQSGDKNHAWKNGASTENHRLRQSAAFKKWRLTVFTRDDYTCVECGQHGGYLEPDHIKPFAYFPELRFQLSNGRTLCKPCHKLTDTYGVKAKRLYENK